MTESAAASAAPRETRVPVWGFALVWLVGWVAVMGVSHYAMYGVVNASQLALAFFLAINILVTFWEISLYLCIDAIEERYRARQEARERGERTGGRSFFLSSVLPSELLSPALWSNVWSEYARYDPSYADRRSFGFAIDVGNGFVTLVPSVIFLLGMTFPILPPVVLGMLGGLLFYQKFYGTVLYFFTFFFNRRHEGHPRAALWGFVGGTNGIWLVFSAAGLYVCARLILDGTYYVLRS